MKEYKYTINGKKYKVVIGDIEGNIANVEVNGESYKVEMEKEAEAPKPISRPVNKPIQSAAKPTKPASQSAAAGSKGVQSPLPGVILDIKVNVGDEIKKGQTVVILEAMKMENNINAERDGKITAINVKIGDSVLEGTDLVMIE